MPSWVEELIAESAAEFMERARQRLQRLRETGDWDEFIASLEAEAQETERRRKDGNAR